MILTPVAQPQKKGHRKRKAKQITPEKSGK